MTEKQIFEAMARLDGFTDSMQTNLSNSPPDYLTSHDAVQRVIDGLDRNESIKFTNTLFFLVPFASKEMNYKWYYTEEASRLLKSTPRQKCEAILRALSKWEEAE